MSLTEGEKPEDLPGGAWQSGTECTYSQDCSFENSTYHVGDCVYVRPAEPSLKPHIVCIERLWEDEAGNTGIVSIQHSHSYSPIAQYNSQPLKYTSSACA